MAIDGDLPCASVFPRVWIDAPMRDNADDLCGLALRVSSFNILADGLARGIAEDDRPPTTPPSRGPEAHYGFNFSSDHGQPLCQGKKFRCRQEFLEWKLRRPKLVALMKEEGADLLGLQELDLARDLDHSGGLFKDMKSGGYTGVAAKKKGRACDGVALLWREDRLTAVGKHEIWKLSPSSVMVALAQRLRLDDQQEFLAVVTHLKAGLNAASEAERCIQAETLIRNVRNAKLPTIVLADLNADRRPVLGDEGVLEPCCHPSLLRSGFRSAVQDVLGEEFVYTCWGGWVGHDVESVFDYVLLYSGDEEAGGGVRRIEARRVLAMPSSEDVVRFPDRLPNPEYPSDHFSVVADLVLRPPHECRMS